MYEISVIIPVFNTEAYVADCLDSLCESTIFHQCEIIVIDDGSRDGSPDILKAYKARYDNIFVYRYPNGGLSSARNRGMEKAHGRYIFFMDSDDRIEPDYLRKLYDCMETTGCDVVCAGFSRMAKTEEAPVPVLRPVLAMHPSSERAAFGGCEYLEARMDADDWHNEVCCALYCRSFLERKHLRFREEIRLYEDILFTNQVLLQACRVCTLPEYGYLYRVREGSLVQSGISQRDIENCLLILAEFRKEYDSCSREQKHAAGRVCFQIISMTLYYIGELNPKDKRRYFRKLDQLALWKLLFRSVSGWKEALKWLIFRLHWSLYYPLVKKSASQKA